jgi:hypothetical protein
MAKFCGKCGSALNDTAAFCGGCGAKLPAGSPAPGSPATSTPAQTAYTPVPLTFATAPATPAPEPVAFTPVPVAFTPAPVTPTPAPPYTPAQTAYTPVPAAYTPGNASPAADAKKSNTLLKVIVACVLVLFVGGALALGGLWYAAQKIKEKAHAVAAQALGGNPAASGGLGEMLGGVASIKGASGSDGSAGGFKGDPCRFLSKEEVSQAVGVQVIRADAKDEGCSYIAKGDPADVTAKHMSSMIGGLGADANTQKTIQKIAGGFFAQQEASDKSLSAEAATGEIPVLVVSFTSGNAEAEMKMNRGAFKYVTGGEGTASSSATGDLDGIGDEAYLAGGSMIIFRKGNTAAHFMYVSCPCNTDNIKPLAKIVASRL